MEICKYSTKYWYTKVLISLFRYHDVVDGIRWNMYAQKKENLRLATAK